MGFNRVARWYLHRVNSIISGRNLPCKAIFYGHRIWIWNIIGFGAFADRIIAERKSNRSILWDMEVCNDLNGVCAFF